MPTHTAFITQHTGELEADLGSGRTKHTAKQNLHQKDTKYNGRGILFSKKCKTAAEMCRTALLHPTICGVQLAMNSRIPDLLDRVSGADRYSRRQSFVFCVMQQRRGGLYTLYSRKHSTAYSLQGGKGRETIQCFLLSFPDFVFIVFC